MGNPMAMGAFGAALVAFALAMAVTIGSKPAEPGVPWYVYSVKEDGDDKPTVKIYGFEGYIKTKEKKDDNPLYYDADENKEEETKKHVKNCDDKPDEKTDINKADGEKEKDQKYSDFWLCKCKAASTPTVALFAVTAAMGGIATGAFGARAFAADSMALYGAGAACAALAFVFAMAATINYEVNCISALHDQEMLYKTNVKDSKYKDDGTGPGAGMILACIAIVFFAAATGIGAVAKPVDAAAPAAKATEEKKADEEEKKEDNTA